MEKELQLVAYEQAKRLKELGFDWNCEWYYRDNLPSPADTLLQSVNNISQDHNSCIHKFSAPTVALALKWMRDEKEMFFQISSITAFDDMGNYAYEFEVRIYSVEDDDVEEEVISGDAIYYTYEAAESALLDELLTLIENQNENT